MLQTDTTPSRAHVTLRFAVVGGGIGGLGVAYSLAKRGHKVTVFEKRKEYQQGTGGCVWCHPNMSGVLKSCGVEEALLGGNNELSAAVGFYLWTGEFLSEVEFHRDMVEGSGSGSFKVAHAVLERSMLKLASGVGADVRLGVSVTSVDVSLPSITLDNGETFTDVDVVVGADGAASIVREAVTGFRDLGTPTGFSTYVFNVPISAMKHDEFLRPLAETKNVRQFLGPRRQFIGARLPNGVEYSVYLTCPSENENEDWTKPASHDLLLEEFKHWSPKLAPLAKHARDIRFLRQVARGPYESWTHLNSKAIIIGDACHPLPIHSLHKVGLTIEDASTLGRLFSRIRRRDQIPFLLNAFQELREERCTRAMKVDGPRLIAVFGNEEEKLDTERFSEMVRAGWKQHTSIVTYEHDSELDKWWAEYGEANGRGRSASTASSINVRVTIEKSETPPAP